jgi:hypothetical protein
MNKPLLTLALTLSCTAAGAASPPATLPASVAACLRVTDAGQRLACYDQSVAALLPATIVAPPAAPVAPAAAPAAAVAATTPAVKAPPAAPVPPPVAAPKVAPAVAAAAPVAAPIAAPPAAPAPTFGQEQLSSKHRPPADPADQTLHAKVTALRAPVPDTYRITLDNGQVWQQQESRFGFSLTAGDSVTLGKGAMGSYRLWRDADGPKAWVRVTRIN